MIGGVYLYIKPSLPDVETLTNIQLNVPLKIYSQDKQLIGEFGEKKRDPVKIEAVPLLFKQAFLAAEDDQFYQHFGLSITGLSRAVFQKLTGSRVQTGGSTITMQVAKNYFLSPERTIIRKVREIFLALQIEADLSKDQILELYVNKIFLGHKSYGIGAAAKVYYGKDINQLSLAEMAMIAGLPKAPSRFNPLSNPERALIRRNWILGRMLNLGYIDQAAFDQASSAAISAEKRRNGLDLHAPYVAEMARQKAFEMFGEEIYSAGYVIFTTIDSQLQQAAKQALQQGIQAYDQRHGFRGAEYRLKDTSAESLTRFFSRNRIITELKPAVVTAVTDEFITLTLSDNSQVQLDADSLASVALYENEDVKRKWRKLSDIIQMGRAVRLKQLEDGSFTISQIPKVQGAFVALDPNNGAILAMRGGYEYYQSKFNRATQAKRQIGSNIKPFIYAAALNQGFTAASLINDAPVVFNDAQLESSWRPGNADSRFLGPIRFREALYRSRNLVSVRLLQQIGLNPMISYLSRFGFEKSALPRDLSLSLGSATFTPLTVANAYAVFANQGFKVEPHLIDEIIRINHGTEYKFNPLIACENCLANIAPQDLSNGGTTSTSEDVETMTNLSATKVPEHSAPDSDEQTPANISIQADEYLALSTAVEQAPRYAERVIDRRVAFIIDDILKDVVKRGTATKAKQLNRPDIAGKTGTTNGPTDAWFTGYAPDIVASAWVGFDDNSNLGRREYGGSAALPIWIEFMQTALANYSIKSRTLPEGIANVLINKQTGRLADPSDSVTEFEYIREENLEQLMNDTSNSASIEDQQIEELFD
ncbi:MAG: PBP1A family penicillin-binding protein [Pseudomonadales bacterium]|nr:PBP1A family penicillin-binding protein [Pseudomonadales bacterium]